MVVVKFEFQAFQQLRSHWKFRRWSPPLAPETYHPMLLRSGLDALPKT